MRYNELNFGTPQFRVLSDNQIENIHLRSLEIIEQVGITFDSQKAIQLLGDSGADVSNPKKVKIPSYLVEQALRTAPKTISLYSRDGEPAFVLNKVSGAHFGSAAGVPYYLDPYSKKPRLCSVEDIEAVARVTDAMQYVEWIFTVDGYRTLPGTIADKVGLLHAMMNTTKPVAVCVSNVESLLEMINVCSMVVGGEEHLRAKPFFVCTVEPVSPLVQGIDAMEKSLLCAEKGIPNVVYNMPMAGATTPATWAGNLAVAWAELLSHLVPIQLKRPGAPVILGGINDVMCMKTGIFPFGDPALSLLMAAITELIHYKGKGIPVFGTAGTSDAKTVGAQAAIDYTDQIIFHALAGTDFPHDIGFLMHSMMVSPELVVLGDEILGKVRIMLGGIEVSEETIPMDLIREVGPGGNYVGAKHTLKHFRNFWKPNLYYRSTDINEEKKDLEDRLNERTIEIIENHKPKRIPDNLLKELMKVEESWFKGVGMKHEYPKTEWMNI